MYQVEIVSSSKELSKKQQVALKNLNGGISIDTSIDTEPTGHIDINGKEIDYYATLHIINDRTESGEYENFIIAMKDGERYTTGSEFFRDTAIDIISDMEGETEVWSLRCFKVKTDKGHCLTCTIV